jgi:hypothetical protein
MSKRHSTESLKSNFLFIPFYNSGKYLPFVNSPSDGSSSSLLNNPTEAEADEDDPELAAALAASLQDVVKRLPEPVGEVPISSGNKGKVVTIQIRGVPEKFSKNKKLERRFCTQTHTINDVFVWLQWECGGTLASLSQYSLLKAGFPKKSRFTLVSSVVLNEDGQAVSNLPLVQVGFEAGQEALTFSC